MQRSSRRNYQSNGWLNWLNIRPEESQRTFLMFAFYTVTSIGLAWLETTTMAMFLEQYQADGSLPWIYIGSAVIGALFGVIYSQLQKVLSLRYVVVFTSLMMAIPLIVFRITLDGFTPGPLWQWLTPALTVFAMQLWTEAIAVINGLNTSVTANQLFNIREIKRAYPLISSGTLLADVLGGFSLKWIVPWVGLPNVCLLASLMMTLGAIILLYLSNRYEQSFPDTRRWKTDERSPESSSRRIRGPLQRYIVQMFGFFCLAQILFQIIDFKFYSHLQSQSQLLQSLFQQQSAEAAIAIFLGTFSGVLGIFELLAQWLFSSRLIERLGLFISATVRPIISALLAALALALTHLSLPNQGLLALASLALLKFSDELLHYTLFASIIPALFQPVPDLMRGRIQSWVRGLAEPLSIGLTGLGLLGLLGLQSSLSAFKINELLLPLTIVLAIALMLTISWMRKSYTELLVRSAERRELGVAINPRELRRAIVERLNQTGSEAHKADCIEMLSQIEGLDLGEVLAPMLAKFSSSLQHQSLSKMIETPNPAYVESVRNLLRGSNPKVLAVALRYVWLSETSPKMEQLKPYLNLEVDPIVRGTAAALMLRRGDSNQKAEATNTLRLMLTHPQEQERVMGCQALGDAVYLQALRLYIPDLLKDRSLKVRRAVLEAIAATKLEEFYPSLLRGLYYQSTRESAMKALVRLQEDAIDLLLKLADDVRKPDVVRLNGWKALGKIATPAAIDRLIDRLMTSWGPTRRTILRLLLEMPNDSGIEQVLDRLGRREVEHLIEQELKFVAQVNAAKLDLGEGRVTGEEADCLRRALQDMEDDAQERLFLLMRILYPASIIRAAAFNLQTNASGSRAQGLEILDNTVDLTHKRVLLTVLEDSSDLAKRQGLAELVAHEPMEPRDRLRHLVNLRPVLSDWALACCFHLARVGAWPLPTEQVQACIEHPRGFVRESVLSYMQELYPQAVAKFLPKLQQDDDPIVKAQVDKILEAIAQQRAAREAAQQAQQPNYRRDRHGNILHFPGGDPVLE
jgi:ATP/ADP translocase/HEAT repeat protein